MKSGIGIQEQQTTKPSAYDNNGKPKSLTPNLSLIRNVSGLSPVKEYLPGGTPEARPRVAGYRDRKSQGHLHSSTTLAESHRRM